tara:strand:+ start:855 stop:1052 length:198 start_codon:yes stop_codon:yes gene_type:complete
MLKLNPKETEVLKHIFDSHYVRKLPPEIKNVALEINRAITNPTRVTEQEYVGLNPTWKHCENCDD